MHNKLRNQLLQFLFFVIVATCIWLVIKLSRNFSGSFEYKVEYVNIPAGKILESASDTVITIGLDTRGTDLIRTRLSKNKPSLRIDLSSLRFRKQGNKLTAYLVAADIHKKISAQLNLRGEILFISPDTLRFSFADESKRKIPVKADISYTLRQQFQLYEPFTLEPDSIWVTGVVSDIGDLEYVSTTPVSLSDLFQDQILRLSLLVPVGRSSLKLSHTGVEARIRVEKFTEASLVLPLSIICPEKPYSLRTFPDSVRVTFLVALIDYKRADASSFKASVLCNDELTASSSKLKVTIDQQPGFVQVTRIEPERVEFIRINNTF